MEYSVIRGVPVVRALDEPVAGAAAAVELIASLRYETDCEKMVLSKACLDESFFRLSSGPGGGGAAEICKLPDAAGHRGGLLPLHQQTPPGFYPREQPGQPGGLLAHGGGGLDWLDRE